MWNSSFPYGMETQVSYLCNLPQTLPISVTLWLQPVAALLLAYHPPFGNQELSTCSPQELPSQHTWFGHVGLSFLKTNHNLPIRSLPLPYLVPRPRTSLHCHQELVLSFFTKMVKAPSTLQLTSQRPGVEAILLNIKQRKLISQPCYKLASS